ncbi:MAG: sugar phosphate isomerase/epimerase [bacterium]
MNPTLSIFPKFFNNLSLLELAGLIRDVGLDTTNLVVRGGFWVSPENIATELPVFMRSMAAEGLQVKFATTGYSARELVLNSDPLKIMADNGIEYFRMGYFSYDRDVHGAITGARADLSELAAKCAAAGIRGVYQVHHGTLISNASAAYMVFNGLSSKSLGVELDPGNQCYEGWENINRSINLLGDYFCAMGIKDTIMKRDTTKINTSSKGWYREFVPLNEGVIDWYEIVRALKAAGFGSHLVFMPFYDENNLPEMRRKLKIEVAYLRQVIADVMGE